MIRNDNSYTCDDCGQSSVTIRLRVIPPDWQNGVLPLLGWIEVGGRWRCPDCQALADRVNAAREAAKP